MTPVDDPRRPVRRGPGVPGRGSGTGDVDEFADEVYQLSPRTFRGRRAHGQRPAGPGRAEGAPGPRTVRDDGTRAPEGAAPRGPAPVGGRASRGADGPVGSRTAAPRISAPRGGRRRVRWRPVVTLVVLFVLAWGAFLVYTPINAWSSVTRVAASPSTVQGTPAKAGRIYLLVGSDSRAGLTSAEKKTLGTGSDAGQRTDTIILVYVADSGKSAMISIPRDSYVPIPGHGSNKINAAFSIGGPPLLIATIENVTDLRIDGYLEVGFEGFAQIVDSLGGVNICVPFDMNDPRANIDLKKGCQLLSGPNALGFVRARYSDPRGDIGRTERQRQFLGAIMKAVATPSTVLVPTRWWDITHSIAAGLAIGEGTSLTDALHIAQTFRGLSSGQTLSLVVPLASISYWTSAGDAVKWDTPRAKALFAMLRDGTVMTTAPAGTNGVPSGR